jgi:hypothetical protein
MTRTIDVEDTAAIGLGECVEALASRPFRPAGEDSLLHAAKALRRLGNDRSFLGDMIVAELADHHREETEGNSYGPQVIMLHPPGVHPDFFIRANIWPSENEHMMRASGGASFVYGLPHDHNFDFLTLGYFGPGYWSEYYEYDYESVAGYAGEPVALRPAGRHRLEEGRILHYRANRDVHAQFPAESLSVTLNIMHTSGAQGWLDQYRFDCDAGRIGAIISPGSSEVFLRIAAGLGGAESLDLTERFAGMHPSDRMRLAAWEALASREVHEAGRDAVWRRAETCGSRLVAGEAQARRRALAA